MGKFVALSVSVVFLSFLVILAPKFANAGEKEFEFEKPELEMQKPEIEVQKPEVEMQKPEVEMEKPEFEMQKQEHGSSGSHGSTSSLRQEDRRADRQQDKGLSTSSVRREDRRLDRRAD
ncbi:MAG: hypothetical protein HY730_01765 [Candidatus Tectomicrobia bacterium]|uniref:Uncharacterized protein n=1 Tax=Tectimicrobiota bacterium TaxID=2528274 RepID=A0A933GJN4_UNCTE|nr:hypothetical protein [Candidatus Tectomicrobia bacterium]